MNMPAASGLPPGSFALPALPRLATGKEDGVYRIAGVAGPPGKAQGIVLEAASGELALHEISWDLAAVNARALIGALISVKRMTPTSLQYVLFFGEPWETTFQQALLQERR